MITINLTTRNRYHTTLPLCLMSILSQTKLPYEIILVDDNEKKEFYDIPIFKEFLKLCKLKNIKFSYYYGQSKGQTYAQQIAFEHTTTEYIYKMDDDNILENDVLRQLSALLSLRNDIGAVSGLILTQKDMNREIEYQPADGIYNKLHELYCYYNIQMCGNQQKYLKKVEHIYSNFMFKKSIIDGYCLDFAPAGHREDTVFTYQIHRNGYELLIEPNVVIWHMHSDGGNKVHNEEMNKKNDIKFVEKLKEWNVIPSKIQLIEEEDKFCTFMYGKKWLVYKK